ncbi:hypothetical protein ACWC9U_24435 [Streptomyces sp. 900116325]
MNLTIKRAVVTAVAAISVLAGSATVASAASPHGGPKHHCKHGKFNQHGKSNKIRYGVRHHRTMHLQGHRLPVKFLVTKGLAHRSH